MQFGGLSLGHLPCGIHAKYYFIAEPVRNKIHTEGHNKGNGHAGPTTQGTPNRYQNNGEEDHQHHCLQHIHDLPPLTTIKKTLTTLSPHDKGSNTLRLSKKES
jgi:hypothetical protein